jgi:hypothetical protein
MRVFLPNFIVGVIFCDLDTSKEENYLHSLKKLSTSWKCLLNSILLVLFFLYGSVRAQADCDSRPQEDCDLYMRPITFNFLVDAGLAGTIGGVSVFILSLTS